jgi:hypothetical protein
MSTAETQSKLVCAFKTDLACRVQVEQVVGCEPTTSVAALLHFTILSSAQVPNSDV